MADYLTVHWPVFDTDPERHVDPAVWLQDGHESLGADLGPKDRVFVYESGSGPAVVEQLANGTERTRRRHTGRQAIVAILELTDPLVDHGEEHRHVYEDGSEKWWRWRAAGEVLVRSGCLHRTAFTELLGYDVNYAFRGFGRGKRGSGLRRLTEREATALEKAYRETIPPRRRSAGGGGTESAVESEAHRQLKEYVAAHPAEVLGEPGVVHVETEYRFETNDRADVVLEDAVGRIIGLEVKVDIAAGDIGGVLQAIKYRSMVEVTESRARGDSRAVLVAHSIAEDVRALCEVYAVECFTVDREAVEEWVADGGCPAR